MTDGSDPPCSSCIDREVQVLLLRQRANMLRRALERITRLKDPSRARATAEGALAAEDAWLHAAVGQRLPSSHPAADPGP